MIKKRQATDKPRSVSSGVARDEHLCTCPHGSGNLSCCLCRRGLVLGTLPDVGVVEWRMDDLHSREVRGRWLIFFSAQHQEAEPSLRHHVSGLWFGSHPESWD